MCIKNGQLNRLQTVHENVVNWLLVHLCTKIQRPYEISTYNVDT